MENLEENNSNLVKSSNKNPVFIIVLIIAVASYALGFNIGKKGYTFQPKEFKVVNQKDIHKTVDYNLLWDAIDTVNEKYIEKPVDPQKTLYGAVRGAVGATGDPYTDFFEPKDLESFKSDLKGSFGGIGAEVSKKNGQIVVVAPIDDSPAKKAGILAKDIILQVNGKSTQEWSVEQAVSEIRGPKGTKVTLTIYREGLTKPFDLTIVRDVIVVKSVKWEVKEVNGKKIGVVTITKFGEDTVELFGKAVNDLRSRSISGLVIDLRNNPGGYLQSAVDMASFWVPEGKVVVTEAKSQGSPEIFNASGDNKLVNTKTVILINGGSASAAEILAGALQDYKIAKLIGEKSFGKGSVQELIELKDGKTVKGAVKVTIAKWITPSGKNLNKDGLNPDIELKLTEENTKDAKDPQMEKALEEITK